VIDMDLTMTEKEAEEWDKMIEELSEDS